MVRRMLLTVTLVAALVGVTAPATADVGSGFNAEKATGAGWTCFPVGDLGVHCAKGGAAGLPVLVFAADGNHFQGTEVLISAEVYLGRPPATDGGGEYRYLGGDFPFYACHHYSTSA